MGNAPSPAGNGGAAAGGSKSRGPGVGENCAAGDACAPGLTCIAYYGFAGARGPQFKTCEIRCERGGKCPAGLNCMTVSDGPGTVCR